tara:strand:+ start:19165 stop:19935 length:771 start_codon:yes stop_codon:yes gene_type:complete
MKTQLKVKKLFNDHQVKDLRFFLNSFSYTNQPLALTEISDYKLLFDIIFSKEIFNFVYDTFNEEVFFYYNFVIQKNNRNYLLNAKYHKDSGKPHQSEIISKNNNLLFKVGIYLQKNEKKKGGGIDVLKPMIFDDLSDKNKFKNKLRALYYMIQDKLFDTHLSTNSGDGVIFNALMSHRTSATDEKMNSELTDKYAIYLQFINLNLIKDVLRATDAHNEFRNEDDIKKNIITISNKNRSFKVLNKEFTKKISYYLGL